MAIAVRLFDRHVGRPVLVAELTESMLVDFLAEYSRRVSPATVNAKRRSLLALWTQAARDGLIPAPDRLRVPKARELRRIPEAWTVEEVSRLVATAMSMKGLVGRVDKSVWWPSLLRSLWETSSRVSAMLSVRPLDCHLDERYLLVRAEHTKQGIDQVYWITSDCADAVSRVYNPHVAHVWEWPFTSRHFYQSLRQIVEAAGLKADKRLAMQLSHKLRRSNLSYTAKNGGIQLAQMQAGHSSPQMTIRHYIDPRIARQQSAVDVLPKLILPDEQRRLF
jgi:integrase